jgi:hypothetical protein
MNFGKSEIRLCNQFRKILTVYNSSAVFTRLQRIHSLMTLAASDSPLRLGRDKVRLRGTAHVPIMADD